MQKVLITFEKNYIETMEDKELRNLKTAYVWMGAEADIVLRVNGDKSVTTQKNSNGESKISVVWDEDFQGGQRTQKIATLKNKEAVLGSNLVLHITNTGQVRILQNRSMLFQVTRAQDGSW